jgi:pimeloyl-ACP methyl ester carboxylesterase
MDAREAAATARHLGKYDLSFDPGEPERYRKDVQNAEVHVLDAGHFALDTAADEIAQLVRAFVK